MKMKNRGEAPSSLKERDWGGTNKTACSCQTSYGKTGERKQGRRIGGKKKREGREYKNAHA